MPAHPKPIRSNPMMEKLAPNPGRYALLPELTPHQELAILCRALHREGYDDHVAGHVTLAQDDGTFLVNPWELTWDEVTADDIIRIDDSGKIIEGEW
ncbi:MAG: class II aldolase/adducin family protein, partial [Marinomonas sp.]